MQRYSADFVYIFAVLSNPRKRNHHVWNEIENKWGNVKNGIFKFIFSLSFFAAGVDCLLCGKTSIPQCGIDCVFSCVLCMGRTRIYLVAFDEYAFELFVRQADYYQPGESNGKGFCCFVFGISYRHVGSV